MTLPKQARSTTAARAKPAATAKRSRRAQEIISAPGVAGIGTSSGGFEVQREFFSAMLADSELRNLLASSAIATLCLDRQLHIKWLTPGMQGVLNFSASDLGRPISEFSEALSNDGLMGDAKAVLRKRTPADKEVKMPNGRWYLRRILPCHTKDDRINGVTITFVDITESKRNAETLEQRVLERTTQLRALTVELSLAEERERRALAQDLHDDLGQVLAAAKIKLGTLAKLEHAEEMKKRCGDIASLLDRAHASIRSLTFQLSPPVLSELGLVPALEWLADEMRRLYDLQIKVLDDGIKKKLDTSVSVILFRAVRELLSNVAKHAKVSRAKVTIRRQGKQIVIQVRDEGIGLHQAKRAKLSKKNTAQRFGLLSVRERLHYIGGEMRLESVPGDGTLVTLTAPLAATTRVPAGKNK
jgi:signal transduction histidine kinase